MVDFNKNFIKEGITIRTLGRFKFFLLTFLLILSTNTARAQQRMEMGDFIFELKDCNLLERTVTCSFSITNKGQKRKLVIESLVDDRRGISANTLIFDDFENPYKASSLQLADKTDDSGSDRAMGVTSDFPHDVPVNASIRFDNVFLHDNKIALLVLSINADTGWGKISGSRFKILFKNIQLGK